MQQQPGLQVVAIGSKQVGQCALLSVMTVSTIDQSNAIIVRCNGRLQGVSCFRGKGLAGHIITCEFRCIDTDQAYFSAVFQMKGIAIVHISNPGCFIQLPGRAGCFSMC